MTPSARFPAAAALLLAALAVASAQDTAPPAAPTGETPVTDAAERRPNRLAEETSPYLLQHAHNPVDWYPWGEEAFARARDTGRPIFLSIGYSSCHWCHVMERESFENEEIAAYLNEHFVSVKVDREERPDIDAIYMTAIQATGQGGGWPLSAFLDHEGRPFFLGTYFPPADRWGRPGFPTILDKIHTAWTGRREDVLAAGEELAKFVRGVNAVTDPAELGDATLLLALDQFRGRHDGRRGGFGDAPKFPRAHALSLLLQVADRGTDPAADRAMVYSSLEAMARGGIHDHVGGGFHRYSTDGVWLVPHFEKMLYDQATLARAYVEAWQLTDAEPFATVARGILDYVLRDMTDPAGGFYAAEDADSEGVEGKFYVWTRAELDALLGDDAALVAAAWGVIDAGNFHGEAEEAPPGANILHHPKPLAELAADLDTTVDAIRARLDAARPVLLAARSQRVRPHLDDKVLAAWNGLMISAFARAGRALDEPRYLAAASRAARFVRDAMTIDGRLHRSWRAGRVSDVEAFLDDHALLGLGWLDLFEATGDPEALDGALDMARAVRTRFAGEDTGAFWDTAELGPLHLARTREHEDWAVPSGNSSAAVLLLRLGRLAGDPELEEAGRGVLHAFSGRLARMPLASPTMIGALDFDRGPTREVVLTGADPADLSRVLAVRYLPRVVTVHRPPGKAGEAVARLLPWLADYGPVDGAPAAYVCTGGTCRAPVTTPDALETALDP